jgi:tRNA dimethylallyltransferase
LESKTKALIIVCGPTAVGKSATGIKLAHGIGGEIVNCDSMQVYKGFDIGTDKPPLEHREGIPHHLLDLVEASTQFTAADFVTAALRACHEILERKKIPIIVGGTGLYIKALCSGLFPGPGKNPEIRRLLEDEHKEKGLVSLHRRLEAVDPAYAQKIGPHDKIRTVRALEVYLSTGKPISEHFHNTKSFVESFHLTLIGLQLERLVLHRRIEERVDRMYEKGLVAEVERLLARGISEDSPPFRALGYKYVLRVLKKLISIEEAVALTKIDTRHYAKRQMTWFRKMNDVNWFSPDDFPSILAFVEGRLR